MVIGYINSTWSMPRRLALISAVFLIPSLDSIEHMYVRSEDRARSACLITKSQAQISPAPSGPKWRRIRMPGRMRRRRIGGTFIDAVAETLGVATDDQCIRQRQMRPGKSKHRRRSAERGLPTPRRSRWTPRSIPITCTEIFIQHLPDIKLALVGASEHTRAPRRASEAALADELRRAARRNGKPASAARDLLADDASGKRSERSGPAGDQLVGQLDEIASKIKAVELPARSDLGTRRAGRAR